MEDSPSYDECDQKLWSAFDRCWLGLIGDADPALWDSDGSTPITEAIKPYNRYYVHLNKWLPYAPFFSSQIYLFPKRLIDIDTRFAYKSTHI